ncbi:2-phospho-L-lactate guanylyltransferase [Subtercola lobariae]|uniref:Phosphoenolpyruvate guanylyltransferase n=1 Tax=Subtercola lobariae TaxID=1588641 RepID=A0A917B2H9_9MICO|nr:2-phospho-L-lactate guanylyltransferase [Subtercola lobariae]GGF16826.1 2-phospho-L-lactate guanylyltransferase [Subtercola lobariae]
MTEWVVVLPVKGSTASKTRLAEFPLSPDERRALALAFARDTLSAIRSATDVTHTIVVTSDAEATEALAALGAEIVPDPLDGLNAAITEGLRFARRHYPQAASAVMTADLPTLATSDVDRMLGLAAGHPKTFVADAAGTGTTTITALPGIDVAPLFGPHSAARHAAAGLASLPVEADSSVRRDVDTPADLERALRGGVGVFTARALAGSGG